MFGDLDDSQLAAVQVGSETIGADGKVTGSLADLSRTDDKTIVARAYDSGSNWVAAGCVDKGLVTGNDSVTITTEATRSPSSSSAWPTVSTAQRRHRSRTTDNGRSVRRDRLDHRPDRRGRRRPPGVVDRVRPSRHGSTPAITAGIDTLTEPSTWQLTNATGVRPSEARAAIHPAPPSLNIGGYATQVRVSWASTPIAPIPQFTTFAALDHVGSAALAVPKTVESRPLRARSCISRTRRAAVIVCIDGNANTVHDCSPCHRRERSRRRSTLGRDVKTVEHRRGRALLGVARAATSTCSRSTARRQPDPGDHRWQRADRARRVAASGCRSTTPRSCRRAAASRRS